MLKLLSFLWSGCWHKWRHIGNIDVYGDGFGNMTKYPVYTKGRYVCDKCGRHKERRI